MQRGRRLRPDRVNGLRDMDTGYGEPTGILASKERDQPESSGNGSVNRLGPVHAKHAMALCKQGSCRLQPLLL